MKKLLLILLVMPSLLFSALPQKGIPEPLDGNPFELLKEIIERNTSNGSEYETNKPEETVQTKETTEIIFPSDIEGAEEIYENPKLTEFESYGDKKLYHLEGEEFVSISDMESHIAHNSSDSKIFDIKKTCEYKKYSDSDSASPRLKQNKKCTNSGLSAGNDCFDNMTYGGGGGYDPNAEGSIEKALEQPSQTDNNQNKKCTNSGLSAGNDCFDNMTYGGGGGYDPAEDEINKKIVKQPIQTTEDEINKEILKQPIQTTKDYKTNTQYRFIKKIDKSVIFAKDSEQLDHKLNPQLNGLGELRINLDASRSAKEYFEATLYVTFTASENNSCVTRSIDNYWYDPNELKLVKEEPGSKIQNTVEDKITPVDDIAITFDGINDSYYDGYNLHERLIESSLNNSEIKIYCSSCTEQKNYSVKVDIDSYKNKHAENVKKQEKIKFDQSVAPLKSQCEEIGFIPGTDKFKNCLVEMMN